MKKDMVWALTEAELPNPDLPFHYLQIWNCFSYRFTLTQLYKE
jgi:hypothetical protein